MVKRAVRCAALPIGYPAPGSFGTELAEEDEFVCEGGTILLNAHCVGIGIYSGVAPMGISK
jgi:hypothetical protein